MKSADFFEVLGELDDDILNEAETPVKRRISWRRWGAAACLVVVLSGFFGYRLLSGGGDYVLTLENGETVRFAKSDGRAASNADMDLTARTLTETELDALFGDLPVTGEICFNEKYDKLLGFDGRLGTIKLVITPPNVQLLDVVVVGREEKTSVDGVPVTAGYFLTRPNSQGSRTAIFYASFALGEYVVYVENAGPDSACDSVSGRLVAAIRDILRNGEIDLSQIPLRTEQQ